MGITDWIEVAWIYVVDFVGNLIPLIDYGSATF